MSIEYIRNHYGVPAKIGARVKYTYKGEKMGTITSAQGSHLMIRFDGDKKPTGPFHPTWEIEYLDGCDNA